MKSIVYVSCGCNAQQVQVEKIEAQAPVKGERIVGDLIKSLVSNSLKERYSLIEKFFEDNPRVFSTELRSEILTHFREVRDQKTAQSRRGVNKRWHKDECAQTSVPQYPSNG